MDNIKFKIAIVSHKIYKRSDIKKNEYKKLILFDKYMIGDESNNIYSPSDNYSWDIQNDEFVEVCIYSTDFSKLEEILNSKTNNQLTSFPKYLPLKFIRLFKEGDVIPLYCDNDTKIFIEFNQLNSKFKQFGKIENIIK